MTPAKTYPIRHHSHLCAVLLLVLCAAGCSIDRVDATSRTRGLSLDMEVRNGDDSIAIYNVDTDGVLEFAGGKSAILGRTDWAGDLTDAELDELHRLVLDELDWFGRDFTSTDEPSDLKYTIRVRGKPGHRKIVITGRNNRIEPVQQLLATAAGRRNKAVLDSLPQPSVENLRP